MKLPSARITNGLFVLVCIAMIATVLLMQKFIGLHPCPLCITQRIFVIVFGVIAAIAFIQNPNRVGLRVYSVLQAFAAIGGAIVAGRHVWLQHLPEDQVPACGPSLEYMFSNFPFQDALNLLFMGDGNCADIVWSFLGLSIPGWALVGFAGLLMGSLFQFFRGLKSDF